MTALLELLKNADPEVKAQLRLAMYIHNYDSWQGFGQSNRHYFI